MDIFLKKKSLFIVSGMMFFFSSCFVGKKYQRPDELSRLNVFRPEYQQVDSSNIAEMDWRSFFRDTVLQGYIQTALDSNNNFLIAQENIKAGNAYYLQATQAFFPSVSIGPGITYTTQSLNTQFGQIIGERRHIAQFDVTAAVSWEADIWGKLSSAKRASLAQWQQSVAAKQAFQTTLVSSVASIYYQLLILDTQKAITQQTIETRTASLETSRALKSAGTLTEVAVQQSNALVLNARALLLTLDYQIKVLENTLNVLLGKPAGPVARLSLDNQSFVNDLTYGVPLQLLSNRPDIRVAEYNLVAALEQVNIAKASFYPAFRITGSTGLQSIDIDHLFSVRSIFANVVGSLTQPLWNRRQLRTQHEVSLANQQIAYLRYRESLIQAGREVSDALAAYDMQDKLIGLKQQEYEAYRNATEYSQELVNYGLANYLEVLRAQENELSAQLSVLNAQYGRINAVITLYKVLGGGWQ